MSSAVFWKSPPWRHLIAVPQVNCSTRLVHWQQKSCRRRLSATRYELSTTNRARCLCPRMCCVVYCNVEHGLSSNQWKSVQPAVRLATPPHTSPAEVVRVHGRFVAVWCMHGRLISGLRRRSHDPNSPSTKLAWLSSAAASLLMLHLKTRIFPSPDTCPTEVTIASIPPAVTDSTANLTLNP